jgi:hypothetical protein
MAKRILNRRELRKASDQAEQKEAAAPKASAKKEKVKGEAAAAKPKKPRKKKEPPRICARWAVYDAGMKQVAVFDYNQRDEAEKKMAEMKAKKNTTYFIQMVKEPMAAAADPEKAEE